jgi:hypothetical protein
MMTSALKFELPPSPFPQADNIRSERSNFEAEVIIEREALSFGPAQASATEKATEKSVAEGPHSSVSSFLAHE